MFARVFSFLRQLPALWASTNQTNPLILAFASDPTLPGGYGDSSWTRNKRLFSATALKIPAKDRKMFTAVNEAVREYMYQPRYDASHDYEHVQRVVNNAHQLYLAEKARNSPLITPDFDIVAMYLDAMCHDVGESKYLEPGKTQLEVVEELLLKCGASPELAMKVALLAVNVSFTAEYTSEDPTSIVEFIKMHPEHAFVQDADRLDALGAIDQGRCFLFHVANHRDRDQTVHVPVILHWERFQHYLPLMKTSVGKEEAYRRWEEMRRFRMEWNRESDVGAVL